MYLRPVKLKAVEGLGHLSMASLIARLRSNQRKMGRINVKFFYSFGFVLLKLIITSNILHFLIKDRKLSGKYCLSENYFELFNILLINICFGLDVLQTQHNQLEGPRGWLLVPSSIGGMMGYILFIPLVEGIMPSTLEADYFCVV